MDETTANVDLETDCLIQQKIKEEFSAFTVVTVADRLDTIINSERTLVLSHGNARERASRGPTTGCLERVLALKSDYS